MADLMQTGVEWLQSQLTASASQSITYARTGQTSLTITATIGRAFFRTNGPTNGPAVSRSDVDFIIDPTDLDFGSGQVIPQRGDQITWNGETYEARAPQGEPLWRRVDAYGSLIRVHTLKVS